MPAVKLSPIFNSQLVDANGAPAVGYKINTYVAGSSSPIATYTDNTGGVAQTNPIVINAYGFPTNGQIWIQVGTAVKFVYTDPTGTVLKTVDYVSGVNDTSTSVDEWADTGISPTYITASTFSMQGDQTTNYHVGRRLKFQVTAGTVYGRITASVFTSLTTITVQLDGAQALDSGLSIAQVSILRANVLSLPDRIALTTGSVNAYVASVGIARLVLGNEYKITFHVANDGALAPTLNLDSNGTLPLLLQNGAVPTAGSIFGEHIVRRTSAGLVVLNPNAESRAGEFFAWGGTTTPAYGLLCNGAAVSRTVYAGLFANIGTTWGAGDGSTTFNLPNIPADYTIAQSNANEGTSTVGQVISHTHNLNVFSSGVGGGSGNYVQTGTNPLAGAIVATGGAANLAASVRARIYMRFK